MKLVWTIILLALLGLFLLGFWTLKSAAVPPTKLETPLELYQAGEKAETPEKRVDAFNEALSMYLDVERAFQPGRGNGKLAFNIANTYYQLQEYPWAALYYYRALELRPQDKSIQQNLDITLNTLKLPASQPASPWEQLFLLKGWVSISRLLQIFAIVTAITFLLASWQIWSPHVWIRGLLMLFVLLSTLLTLNLGYQYYFSPIEAVIIQATPLYRGAGVQYAFVLDKPIPGGLKVEVLDAPANGEWLKVRTPDDNLGFVSASSIRMLYK